MKINLMSVFRRELLTCYRPVLVTVDGLEPLISDSYPEKTEQNRRLMRRLLTVGPHSDHCSVLTLKTFDVSTSDIDKSNFWQNNKYRNETYFIIFGLNKNYSKLAIFAK